MIDLILGAAVGYTPQQMAPFVNSLKATGYKGQLVLFAGSEIEKWLKKEDWIVVLAPPPVKTLPHAERFYWMEDLLHRMEDISVLASEGVLCTDTRDVFFQSDPGILPSSCLHVFEEDWTMTLGTCPYNREWLEIGYGSEITRTLAHHPILCVGTFCGGYIPVMQYLGHLAVEIHGLQSRTRKPQDQAAHNYLIREGLSGEHIVHPNECSDVYTIGYIKDRKLELVDGKIVNKWGQVPCVIHQYDRKQHRHLAAHVEQFYGMRLDENVDRRSDPLPTRC